MYILTSATDTQAFVPFLESNPVFFEALLSVISVIVGVWAIVFGIRNLVKEKQDDARFGFYINLLALLKRSKQLLDDYPAIPELLWRPDLRQKVFSREMSKECEEIIAPIFLSLCGEVLTYITTSQNNIPPCKKKDKSKWNMWYANILTLCQFFEKCKFIHTGLFPYFDESDKESFEKERKSFIGAIEQMEKDIQSFLKLTE